MSFYVKLPFSRELFVERTTKCFFSLETTQTMLYKDIQACLFGLRIIWSKPNVEKRR